MILRIVLLCLSFSSYVIRFSTTLFYTGTSLYILN